MDNIPEAAVQIPEANWFNRYRLETIIKAMKEVVEQEETTKKCFFLDISNDVQMTSDGSLMLV